MMAMAEWRDRAACLGTTALFFGHRGEMKRDADRREARAIRLCKGCPVLDQCRADEDEMPTRWGVRAAENVEQRVKRRNVGRGAPGIKQSNYVGGKRQGVA